MIEIICYQNFHILFTSHFCYWVCHWLRNSVRCQSKCESVWVCFCVHFIGRGNHFCPGSRSKLTWPFWQIKREKMAIPLTLYKGFFPSQHFPNLASHLFAISFIHIRSIQLFGIYLNRSHIAIVYWRNISNLYVFLSRLMDMDKVKQFFFFLTQVKW